MKRVALILACICAAPVFAQATAQDIYVNAVIGGASIGGLILLVAIYKFGKSLARKVHQTMSATSQISQTSHIESQRKQPEPPLSNKAASTHTHVQGQVGLGTNMNEPSEAFWAEALAEFEGPARRPGLWARSFAAGYGDESIVKGSYLSQRANELQAEHEARIAADSEKRRLVEDAERRRVEEELAALRKGKCPNDWCGAIISLRSQACPKCGALFEEGAAWKVLPI